MRGRRTLTAVVMLAAIALLSACIGTPPPDNPPSRLAGVVVVQAPSALKTAMQRLAAQFETANPGVDIQLAFDPPDPEPETPAPTAAPGVVITERLQGAPAKTTATPTAAAVAPFAVAQLVIAVAPENPKGLSKIQDLSRAGLRVALCAGNIPCGQAASALLKTAKVTLHGATRTPDTPSASKLVQNDEADAALIYRSDTKAAGDSLSTVEIPTSGSAKVVFIADGRPDAAKAENISAFIDFLHSSGAEDTLAQLGFQQP